MTTLKERALRKALLVLLRCMTNLNDDTVFVHQTIARAQRHLIRLEIADARQRSKSKKQNT